MSLKRGDVIKRLENGVCPLGAHPVVILLVLGDRVVFSNITDIEKEDFIHCILEPDDDPRIITKKSTFRYQDIAEIRVLALEAAIKKGNIRECGQLKTGAFNKIIAGSQLPENGIIKPKFKTLLKPN